MEDHQGKIGGASLFFLDETTSESANRRAVPLMCFAK